MCRDESSSLTPSLQERRRACYRGKSPLPQHSPFPCKRNEWSPQSFRERDICFIRISNEMVMLTNMLYTTLNEKTVSQLLFSSEFLAFELSFWNGAKTQHGDHITECVGYKKHWQQYKVSEHAMTKINFKISPIKNITKAYPCWTHPRWVSQAKVGPQHSQGLTQVPPGVTQK